jgi:WAS/WASL-interacting protein
MGMNMPMPPGPGRSPPAQRANDGPPQLGGLFAGGMPKLKPTGHASSAG